MSQPPTEEPPPPPSPCPWRWRCHRCHLWYDLHCTRRCLECSHYFCSRPSSNSAQPKGHHRQSRKQRRTGQGVCTSQFDYIAWSRWGSWRRTVLAQRRRHADQHGQRATSSSSVLIPGHNLGAGTKRKASTMSSTKTHLYEAFATYQFQARTIEGEENVWVPVPINVEEKTKNRKQVLFCSGKYDCSLHCDSPSECVHKRFSAKMDGRQSKQLGDLEAVDEDEEQAEERPAAGASSHSGKDGEMDLEKELQRQVRRFLSAGCEELEAAYQNNIGKAITTDHYTPSHGQPIYELYDGSGSTGDFCSAATEPDSDVDMDDYVSDAFSHSTSGG